MPAQFPFLQLLSRVFCQRELNGHSATLGMRSNLQCTAHLQKTQNKQTVSRCLGSEVGAHSEVDKVPFHTAVWFPMNLCMVAVSPLGCVRLFAALLST